MEKCVKSQQIKFELNERKNIYNKSWLDLGDAHKNNKSRAAAKNFG